MASLSLEEAHAHLKTLRKKGLAVHLSKTRKKKHRQTLKSAPSLFPTQSGDHIYVGNSASARAVSTLLTLGIGAVLNCAPSMCKDPVVKYRKHDIRYFELDCHDNQQFNILSPKVYDAAKAFIAQNQEEGRNVLVHCYAGINRSATLAVAYIVEREQKQLFEVFQQCFTARHGIISNKSFQVQLLNFASQKSLLNRGGWTEVHSTKCTDQHLGLSHVNEWQALLQVAGQRICVRAVRSTTMTGHASI